jgi:hypothetical protein
MVATTASERDKIVYDIDFTDFDPSTRKCYRLHVLFLNIIKYHIYNNIPIIDDVES